MKVHLKDVRLAFPNLFEAKSVQDSGQAKFSASFIFPPDHPAVKEIKDAMAHVAKEKWGEKAAATFKTIKAQNRLALHDGAEKAGQYEGYEGNMYINASNALRPTVVDRDPRVALNVADGKPYSGCYVNGIVELWAQDNKYGKRINASLMGVQFYRDGQRLAGGAVASEDDFEEIPVEEGETTGFGDEEKAATAPSEEDVFA